MRELKKALRRELIERRRGLVPEEKALRDKDIFMQLMPLVQRADVVFTYVSTEIEVDTRLLMSHCFAMGIPVAVPVSGDTELDFFFIRSFGELSEGRYGIMEPVCRTNAAVPTGRSLCVVPALCADGSGLRLGYGKGYYDRYLSGFPGTSVIICYSDFRREVPAEPHDRRADITIFDRV